MFDVRLPDWSKAGSYTSAYRNINTNEVLFAETINNKVKAFSGTAELLMQHWRLIETKEPLENNQFKINYFHNSFDTTLLNTKSKEFIQFILQEKNHTFSFYIHFSNKKYTSTYPQRFLETIKHSITNIENNSTISILYFGLNINIQLIDNFYLKFDVDGANFTEFRKIRNIVEHFLTDIQLRTNHFVSYQECFNILNIKDFEVFDLNKKITHF